MFRTTDTVLIAVMVSAAAFTYQTKHDAEDELRALRRIESQIRYEEETADLLRADWSLLTQPVRLQTLAEAYKDELNLHPIDARQIADLAEIPLPTIDVDAPGAALGGRLVSEGTDATTTGSTPR
ncbi:hypothetical protein EJC49_12960 [Aquibium carbonis]|uniref:Cell division protein FtsL n=1 Tax=Aquibium carbonis TaxID=2495581 RepID=A0A3R9Y938_9HYPH|nr:hypothetical protein [Aquibium carbonis]RST85965.1 hypothetical protein EJC49_12960 [Aquibium carbonis]